MTVPIDSTFPSSLFSLLLLLLLLLDDLPVVH
jgi:hypothetical protein